MFAGAQVPGVPRNMFYGDLVWRDEGSGLFAGVEHRRATRVYANDTNADFASGYKLTDLRAGVTRRPSSVHGAVVRTPEQRLQREVHRRRGSQLDDGCLARPPPNATSSSA